MSEEKEIKAIVQKENESLHLSVERTLLALERTHLAWIRTMFTLITAGFAIDKGFEIIHKQRLMAGTAWVENGHLAGISLTAVSTIILLVESIQYVKRSRQLSQMKKEIFSFFSVGVILSALVFFLGITLASLIVFTG